MSESTEIVRREDRPPLAIEALLGTGDMELMVETARHNVNIAIEIARTKGFVTDYEVKNKQGEVIGLKAWYHHPTWQLLGQTYGVTAFTEGDPREVKPGEWQAAAICAVLDDGRIVGRAVALCSRTEPGKKFKNDHELAATAQSRAQRNALRSTLGAILVVAGFDFPDPEAPATNPQVGILHQLEHDLGWSHDDGHEAAGVASYKDLNREQAAELIDQWQALKDARPEPRPDPVPAGASPPAAPSAGERSEDSPESSSFSPRDSGASDQAPEEPETGDGPATAEHWGIATNHGFKSGTVLRKARELFPDRGITSAPALTKKELAAVIEALL